MRNQFSDSSKLWQAISTEPGKVHLAAAVVDRLTFNAHIIQTGANSYRLRSSRARTQTARRRDS